MSFTNHNSPIDGWSIIHFLSGAILAMSGLVIVLDFKIAFGISLILFIIWEFIESFFHIGEPLPNAITDIILGVVGFLIFWRMFSSNTMESQSYIIFGIVFIQFTLFILAKKLPPHLR
jgi:hypothetical protein